MAVKVEPPDKNLVTLFIYLKGGRFVQVFNVKRSVVTRFLIDLYEGKQGGNFIFHTEDGIPVVSNLNEIQLATTDGPTDPDFSPFTGFIQ